MKLLLDQGLPRTAAKLLSEAGVETIHVGDIGYASADDADIIEFARRGGFIIVTLDADFHALLALSGAAAPSVIRIRMEGLRSESLTSLLRTIVQLWGKELESGAVVTAQEERLRIRRLPLVSV
jgi:predicted nuclease of predicted toxin-antitoxin system